MLLTLLSTYVMPNDNCECIYYATDNNFHVMFFQDADSVEQKLMHTFISFGNAPSVTFADKQCSCVCTYVHNAEYVIMCVVLSGNVSRHMLNLSLINRKYPMTLMKQNIC